MKSSHARAFARSLACALALMLATGIAGAQSTGTTVVASTANPQYAGQASTPNPNFGTVAPCAALPAGTTSATFAVTGLVNASAGNPNPIYQFYGPDGTNTYGPVTAGPANGISGIQSTSQRLFLIGVFLDASVPSGVAPASLVYTGNPSFASAAPLLRQLFWIGDGLTGTASGTPQVFTPPAGATRICFGIEDSGNPAANLPLDGYSDNGGSFTVNWTFAASAAPSPGAAIPTLSPLALAVLALLVAAAALLRARRR